MPRFKNKRLCFRSYNKFYKQKRLKNSSENSNFPSPKKIYINNK